jgi:putative transposase
LLKAIKVRLYPNKVQQSTLERLFGCYRFTYNKCLVYKQNNYNSGTIITYNQLGSYINKTLTKEHAFLQEFNSNILKVSVDVLKKSYNSFFKKISGYPKFKLKSNDQSVKFMNPTCISKYNLDNDKLNLTKNIKNLKFETSDKYKSYLYKYRKQIKSITISKSVCGNYFASILIDSSEKLNNKIIQKPKNYAVGVDLGIKTFAVCSSSETFDNLNFYKNVENQIKKLQRQLSRKEKGSKNRNKARIKLAKLFNKINNKKSNYLHQITNKLVNENQVIVLEDLNVNGMLKNHNLAKAIQQLSLFEFKRQLDYKCKWYNRNLVIIDRWFPSSKLCSGCGSIKKDLKLSDRTYICPVCGLIIDRDYNAALNIKNEGLNILRQWLPEVKFVDCPTVDDINNNIVALKSSDRMKQKQILN